MNVYTTRSGRVLHGTAKCPDLRGRRVFVLDEADVLPRAVRCTHGHCHAVFLRGVGEAKAA